MRQKVILTHLVTAILVGLVVGAGVWVLAPEKKITEEVEVPAPERYREYSEFLGMPPSDFEGTLRAHVWAGMEEEEHWNVGEYAFTNLYPNVEVIFTSMIDEASAFAKFKATPKFADIAHMYTDAPGTKRWVDAGLLSPLDPDLIPVYDEIYPSLLALDECWVDGKLYAIPTIDTGYTSFIFNTDTFTELGIPEEEWNDLGVMYRHHDKLAGKIFAYDSAMEVLTLTASVAGIPKEDVWQMTPEQEDMVTAMLDELKPNIGGFWTGWEAGYTALITGEAAAIIGWADQALWSKMGDDEELGTEDDLPTEFLWPEPPQYLFAWFGLQGIRAGLKEENPELWKVAHAFLNARSSADVGASHIDSWALGTGNRLSIERCEHPEYMTVMHMEDPPWALERAVVGGYMGDYYEPFQDLYLTWRAGV